MQNKKNSRISLPAGDWDIPKIPHPNITTCITYLLKSFEHPGLAAHSSLVSCRIDPFMLVWYSLVTLSVRLLALKVRKFSEWNCGKGQIISKGLFGVFEFSQKTNKQIRFWYCQAKKTNLFIHFLEESEDTKSCFEII